MAGRDTVENVDVTIKATDKASKTIDAVADNLDRLEDVELDVAADDNASRTLDDVQAKADDLDRSDPTVDAELGTEARRLKSDITDILDEARKLDRADVELDVDVNSKQAVKDLDSVKGSSEGVKEQVVTDVRDMTGVLGGGEFAGAVGDFGEAFVGAGNIAGTALSGIGLDITKLIGPLAVGGIAFGAVKYFWDNFINGGDEAKKKLEEVQRAMAAGDFGEAAKGITKALEPVRDIMTEVGLTTEQATKFITGQTDELGLHEGALDDDEVTHRHLVATLNRARDSWKENTAAIAADQFAQFEATRAIGATNEAFLEQARVALPEVQNAILKHVAAVNGIPLQRITEILADTDPDNVKQVEDELDAVAEKKRTAEVGVSANTKPAEQDLADWIREVSQRTVFVDFRGREHAPGAGAMAGTPYWRGGPIRVGEAGPEDLWLPRGSRVDTAGTTAARDRAGGAGTTVNYYVNVAVPLGTPTPAVGRFVADALAVHEQRTGSRRRLL